MVLLKEIFDLLATGEFQNISLSRKDSGEINEKAYPQVAGYLNLGIVEIHKRFNLRQSELTLHTLPGVETYYLRNSKAGAVSSMGDKAYIVRPTAQEDLEGFLNIVKVLTVYGADNAPIELNNRYGTPIIVQKSFDTLKITGYTTPQILQVEYQSWPDKICIEDGFDPANILIDISDAIVEPLLHYVGMRTYKPMGSNDSTANADKSSAYQAQYELALTKMDLYGMDTQFNDEEDTFLARGWA
jgi:hypothetical protein